MKYLLLATCLVACSHAPQQLSEQANEIEVVTNKPTGCSTVGRVVGVNEESSKELAINDALNQAAKLKANTLHINQEIPNGKIMTVHATAYLCE